MVQSLLGVRNLTKHGKAESLNEIVSEYIKVIDYSKNFKRQIVKEDPLKSHTIFIMMLNNVKSKESKTIIYIFPL
jgi:hypothetical protein